MRRRNNRMEMMLALASAAIALLAAPQAAWSQAQTGSITGTVTNGDKKPVQNTTTLLVSGVFVDIQPHATTVVYNPNDATFQRGPLGDKASGGRQGTDLNLGGLYTFDTLKPGVYDMLVEAGSLPGDIHYRPQRILGVVVKPGKETDLDITMHEGDALEEVGTPVVDTPKALKSAWLEGTVTDAGGKPIMNPRTLLVSGCLLTIKRPSAKEQATTETDRMAGGFFSAENLFPGAYDLVVEAGLNGTTHFRPQILHVTLKPGVRTLVHIVMHEGDALERVTAPDIKTQPVTVAS